MTVATNLRERLTQLRALREVSKSANRRPRGPRLSRAEREVVLSSTGGRCHICGGLIEGSWQADHVKPHSAGGAHSTDNYLPAHSVCNNYRWDYMAEEFEMILKLGVWARTQVERGTTVGRAIEKEFSSYEVSRLKRRKSMQV